MRQADWLDRLRHSLPEQGRATVVVVREDGIANISLCADDLVRNQVKTRILARSLVAVSLTAVIGLFFQTYSNTSSSLAQKFQIAQSEERLATLKLLAESASRSLPFATDTTPITSEYYVDSQIESFAKIIQLQDEFLRFYLSYTKPLLNQELGVIVASFNEAGIDIDDIPDRILPGDRVESSVLSDEFLHLSSNYIDEGLNDLMYKYSEARHLIEVLPTLKPVGDARTSSGFGTRRDPFSNERKLHRGIDLVSFSTSEVMSTADGQVIFAGWDSAGYGNKIVIDHGNDLSTLYAHLDTVSVAPNQVVMAGEVIGMIGSTGRSTARHLHYETRVNGYRIDPSKLFGLRKYVQ